MIARILRGGAVVLAVSGLVQPAFTIHRPAPLALAVTSAPASGSGASDPRTMKVARRLSESLGRAVAINGDGVPGAVVIVGDAISDAPLDLPTSVVTGAVRRAPRVSIVSVREPTAVLPGWESAFEVELEAHDLRGRTSTVTLEQQGIPLARGVQRWANDYERATIRLTVVPPSAGAWPLQVRVDSGGPAAAGAVDVRLLSTPRSLRIAVYDPRPNWNTAFVRRVLESDPAFDVSALIRASRGLDVRAGRPPSLTADGLMPFDALLVGAPEELAATDVEAIRPFLRRRGGTVVLLPDRKPSGPYLELLPSKAFDEVLLERPAEITTGPRPVRGGEFAIPRAAGAGATILASLPQGSVSRPVIASWPAGDGRIIFSGALDAWRYRGEDGDAFAAFWRTAIASAAMASPRRMEVRVDPGVAPPGWPVTVRVRLRGTELVERDGVGMPPAVRGEVVDLRSGAATFLRLWPVAAEGEFEGRIVAAASGRYDVRVAAQGGAAADTPLLVSPAARPAERADTDAARFLTSATGGVVADPDDLTALERHLRGLPRPDELRRVHPARSVWWAGAFVVLASAEWALRRRRGQR